MNIILKLLICFFVLTSGISRAQESTSEIPTDIQSVQTDERAESVPKPETLPRNRYDSANSAYSELERAEKNEENGMGRFFSEMLNMFFALGLIIAIMLVIAWVLKRLLNTRLQQMNSTSSIKILERRTLNPKASLYLLDICGKGIVIAESHAGITHLGEVPLNSQDPVEDSEKQNPTTFGKILHEKMKEE